MRYDTQGPLRLESECRRMAIGHVGCVQVELGHTEILMDAIQVGIRSEKKGRQAAGMHGVNNATSKLSYRKVIIG